MTIYWDQITKKPINEVFTILCLKRKLSLTKLSQKMRISRTTLTKKLRELNFPIRESTKSETYDSIIKRVLKLNTEDLTCEEIARLVGTNRNYAQKICIMKGLPYKKWRYYGKNNKNCI